MGIQFQTCDILRYCKRTFKGTIRIPLVVKKIIPRQNVGQMSNASYGRYVSRNTLKCRIPVAERRESRRAFLSSSKKGFIVTDTRHSTLLPALKFSSPCIRGVSRDSSSFLSSPSPAFLQPR